MIRIRFLIVSELFGGHDTNMLHVWNIYQHLPHLYGPNVGKCDGSKPIIPLFEGMNIYLRIKKSGSAGH